MDRNMDTMSLADTRKVPPTMMKVRIKGYSIILNWPPILLTMFVSYTKLLVIRL